MTSDLDELFESARALSEAADSIRQQADEQRRRAVLAAIAQGMSQTEVARRLGITQQRVAQIMRNTR